MLFRSGPSYNAQCWAEARRFAAQYLVRLPARYPALADALAAAVAAAGRSADALARVAGRFPFPGFGHAVTADDRHAAVADLRLARAADLDAAIAVSALDFAKFGS